jgi:hypothetical protein
MMSKRKVFHSSPSVDGWKVTSGGKTLSHHRTQGNSEKAAIRAGHKAEDAGGLGQAVLHRSDGTIREERTYGKDPGRYPG